jgi:type IX secretion system PorP/SprF family membrane protein
MKNFYLPWLIAGLLIGGLARRAEAQDFNFSQYYFAPLSLNPALTGIHRYDYRVGVLHREQWQAISAPFRTTQAWGDIKFRLPRRRPVDHAAIGLMLVNDDLGDGIYSIQHAQISGAVSQWLDAKGRATLSVGGQAGYLRKQLRNPGLYQSQVRDDFSFDPDKASGEGPIGPSISSLNVSAGAVYAYQMTRRRVLSTGLAAHNLARPRETFSSTRRRGINRLRTPVRYLGHITVAQQLSQRLTLIPSAIGTFQAGAIDATGGLQLGYQLNRPRTIQNYVNPMQIVMYAGGYYRLGDAIIVMTALRYKRWLGALSYDLTQSRLRDTDNVPNIRGGTVGTLEFSLAYSGFLRDNRDKRLSVPCTIY